VHRAIFCWRNTKQIPPEYTALNMIISALIKVGATLKDKIVLACDGRGNWRKAYESKYKANRKEYRESFEDIDWNDMWKRFNDLLFKIDKALPFYIIKIDRIEADDIASCIVRTFKDNPIVLVSYDSDWELLWHYCVSLDTEILTLHGWKKYNELKKQQYVATYNLKKECIEYTNLTAINIFDYDGKLYHIKNKSLDILSTPNHLNIVKYKTHRNNKRAYITIRTKSENLRKNDKICVQAKRFIYDSKYSIGTVWAELIGWFISEGYFINKDQKSIMISQSYRVNKNKVNRITSLLLKAKIPFKIYKHDKNMRLWYINRCAFVDWIYNVIPNKELNEKLTTLPPKELKSLFRGLMLGDESKMKIFAQKNKNTIDWFEILATKLGYHVNTIKSKNQDTYRVYLTKKTHIGLNYTKINQVSYKGKVWCPSTKNETWIARRNGKVFITGNSNVNIYSQLVKYKGKKGAYKVKPENFNAYSVLSKKINKETTDNLIDKITNVEEYENRKLCVNLIELPDFVDDAIKDSLIDLEAFDKEYDINYMPFQTLKQKFLELFDGKYERQSITYEGCVLENNKKEDKKTKRRRK